LENQYQQDKLAENLGSAQMSLVVVGTAVGGYSLLQIFTHLEDVPGVVFQVVMSAAFLAVTGLMRVRSVLRYSRVYVTVYYVTLQMFFLVSQVRFKMYSLPVLLFGPYFILLGFNYHWFTLTVTVFLGTIPALINFISHSKETSPQILYDSIAYTFIYLTLCSLSSIITYHIDKSKRLEFLLIQKVMIEIQKTKGVLNFLLPAFVRKRVKEGVRFISENQGVVSIIFCDIENYETLLKEYSQKELTIFIDELFSRIDHICHLSGCTKIETVGKTYMACAGLKESELELDVYYSSIPASRRCVEMAAAILRLAESVHLKSGESIRFKLGIHSGEVTAGVVGYHKPQFSLVGDTVNTASRMASLCPESNVVQISQAAYDTIGETSGFTFTRSQIQAKGKGLLATFLVSLPVSAEPPSSSSKLGLNNSLSLSELFTFKSVNRSRKQTRRTTLYNFSNQHADHDQRRSSLIELLNEDISPDDGFIRRETEIIEQAKWFTFSCSESLKEKKFRLEISETNFPVILWSGVLRIACNGLLLVLMVVEISVEKDFKDFYEIVRLVVEIIAEGWILMKLRKKFNEFSFVWTIGLVYMIGAVSKIGISWKSPDLIFADFIVHSLQVAHCSQLYFKHFIWIVLGLFCSFIVFMSVTRISGFAEMIYGLFVCLLILTYSVYLREKTLRFYSNITKAANKELKRINELLTEMMPKHVFETLREQNTVTEKISNATILYADIVGFTQWSSSKTPGEVVNMLSDLFTQFDMKCKEHQVYKVHTIGDCYVAMGYLQSHNRNYQEECKNLIFFALDLVKIIQEVNLERGIELNMRIGVHTGDIIGGITGTSIVRYDIYGIDVLIANKMESSGIPGKVKISQKTFELLEYRFPGMFLFEEDKIVEVAGKQIRTYFVNLNN
jgi:phospholipid-translocating ATPase